MMYNYIVALKATRQQCFESDVFVSEAYFGKVWGLSVLYRLLPALPASAKTQGITSLETGQHIYLVQI